MNIPNYDKCVKYALAMKGIAGETLQDTDLRVFERHTANPGTVFTALRKDGIMIPMVNATLLGEYHVETTATEPYTKTLSGTFALVVGHYGLSYEIDDSINSPYLNIRITNTLDYYVVRQAFGNYTVGTQLDVDTYLDLSDTNKEKCASSIITLAFDPTEILLDMTSEEYQNALSVNTETINGYEYINSISFKIDAMSSNQIKFYKVDVSENYTYPNNNDSSIITVTYS